MVRSRFINLAAGLLAACTVASACLVLAAPAPVIVAVSAAGFFATLVLTEIFSFALRQANQVPTGEAGLVSALRRMSPPPQTGTPPATASA